jgi:hypothetical protein
MGRWASSKGVNGNRPFSKGFDEMVGIPERKRSEIATPLRITADGAIL